MPTDPAKTGALAGAPEAVLGTLALSTHDQYRQGCATGNCNQSLYSDGHNMAIATDVLIGIGSITAATSLVLFVARRHARRLSVAPTAGGFSLAGTF